MPNVSTYATPRADLAQAMAEYDFSKKNFIGFQVMPSLLVPLQAATFAKIVREGLLRREDVKRTVRSGYKRSEWEFEDDTYQCYEYGLEQALDDSERARFSRDFDSEFWAAKIAYERVLREHEIRVATAIFNTSTWTGAALTTAASAVWSNVGTDILSDVTAAKEKVRSLTGMMPNTLIVSQKVLGLIRKNTGLINAVSYVQLASERNVLNAIADWLGLEQILVGGGVYNSDPEGDTSLTGVDIWDDGYAMVCVGARAGDPLQTPCIGRTLCWQADSPETDGLIVEEYREEQIRSWIYRARHNVDEKVMDANYGHLINTVTS
jgi:hypothetical protein